MLFNLKCLGDALGFSSAGFVKQTDDSYVTISGRLDRRFSRQLLQIEALLSPLSLNVPENAGSYGFAYE
jgi:hypothetical protein